MQKKLIIMYGPTATGKSSWATELAKHYPFEIINADVGQLYTPLSIGTAKPDWKHEAAPHHLFDMINEPRDFTVVEYRQAVLAKIDEIVQRGNIPLMVGGSGFYIKSLFFPPKEQEKCFEVQARPSRCAEGDSLHLVEDGTLGDSSDDTLGETIQVVPETADLCNEDAWDILAKLDPLRAAAIYKQDRYRIERALQLIKTTGSAHSLEPQFIDPGFPYFCIGLMRDRKELYDRINLRTETMLQEGWIEEVERLKGTAWEPFLQRKKLLGYPELLGIVGKKSFEVEVAKVIAQKTRHYAKRQMTFWRMFERELKKYTQLPSNVVTYEANATEKSFIQLSSMVDRFINESERGT